MLRISPQIRQGKPVYVNLKVYNFCFLYSMTDSQKSMLGTLTASSSPTLTAAIAGSFHVAIGCLSFIPTAKLVANYTQQVDTCLVLNKTAKGYLPPLNQDLVSQVEW